MKIQFISDLHNHYDEIEIKESDVLCITGDIFDVCNEEEINDFKIWCKFIVLRKVKQIIIVPGNHDLILTIPYYRDLISEKRIKVLRRFNNSFNYEGIEFSAFEFCELSRWAFYLDKTEMKKQIDKIDKCDVLLSHIPAYGVLDYTTNMRSEHAGSNDLLLKIIELKPIIHAHGHIHEEYGIRKGVDTLSINSSMCNISNEIDKKRESMIVDINPMFKLIDYKNSDLPTRNYDE